MGVSAKIKDNIFAGGLESAGGDHLTARFERGSEQPEFDNIRGSYAVPQERAGGLRPAVGRFMECWTWWVPAAKGVEVFRAW
ncbi:hypothetical protein INS49_014125 [Diaporthe citri]|uniref:uncharacterized protein n=1 Tax=Diaporthe citri TaxID=83186 RepID=UPI001C80D7A8|nr:uncharacterized protein INS49_014125 [Diaporthe citri]KAG6358241.1 hypothetical protein INS49_014125 [Diaporthe citri]